MKDSLKRRELEARFQEEGHQWHLVEMKGSWIRLEVESVEQSGRGGKIFFIWMNLGPMDLNAS